MDCYVIGPLNFEWDDEKNVSNQVRHGLSFETAARIWESPIRVFESEDDRDYEGEIRWVALGPLPEVDKFVVMVYCERGEKNRIISARYAEKNEEAAYFKRLAKFFPVCSNPHPRKG